MEEEKKKKCYLRKFIPNYWISSRRRRYFLKCQFIVDDLHDRVEKGQFVYDSDCMELYGKSEYRALLHELRLMNVDDDYTEMTPAVEWLYSSQYFKHKAKDEIRETVLTLVSLISAVTALIAVFYK